MRPTWASVKLDHIASNYQRIKSLVGNDIAVMAVVKADAYGHGAVPIALHLEKYSVDWFGVALAEEGIRLRNAGVKTPILALGGFWQLEDARACVQNDLTPALYRVDMIDTLATAAREAGHTVKFHLKIDSGMNRMGLLPSDLTTFLAKLKQHPMLQFDGVMTHLASADEQIKDDFTSDQINCFRECQQLIGAHGFMPKYQHISNSAGTMGWPIARGNLVRAGGLLYGFHDTLRPADHHAQFLPALSLHSRIILLKRVPAGSLIGYGGSFRTERETLLATLPIGYEDGYRRAYSNNAQVLVRGQFASVVGRVSMDLTIIDVTDIAGVSLGDEVLLIGSAGQHQITAEQSAASIGTISYEITCGLTSRVPRFHHIGDQDALAAD